MQCPGRPKAAKRLRQTLIQGSAKLALWRPELKSLRLFTYTYMASMALAKLSVGPPLASGVSRGAKELQGRPRFIMMLSHHKDAKVSHELARS
jgi:hypothetical protein